MCKEIKLPRHDSEMSINNKDVTIIMVARKKPQGNYKRQKRSRIKNIFGILIKNDVCTQTIFIHL